MCTCAPYSFLCLVSLTVVRSQSSDVTAHKSQNCLQNVTAEVETLPFDCEKELNDTIDLLALKDDYEVEKVKVLWGGIATLMLMTESTSPIERAVVILELYFTVLAPEGTPLDEDLSQRLEVILETIYVRDYPSSYERYLLLATEILHFAEQPARIERYNIHNDPLILKTVYVASDFQWVKKHK